MTLLSSVAQANSKTAEFARLFDLFDRVATRRTRTLAGDTSEPISADDIANVPAEFAPVLKDVATILSSRALRDEARALRARATSATHKHIASIPSTTFPPGNDPMPRDDAMDLSDQIVQVAQDPESPTFPIGGRYPFTFKLMLHKLYDLDEWAEKVKNALETSKSQFKPLAERVQNVVREARTNMKERGEKRVGGRHSPAKSKSPSAPRYPTPVAMSSKPEDGRVVKKRCIGRRKSVGGPMSTSVWVYDAAISAVEITGSRPSVEITLSKPRQSGSVEGRARHRSLPVTVLEEKRKIRINIPVLQEEVFGSVPPRTPSISFAESARRLIAMENEVKMKTWKPLGSPLVSELRKRVAMKRPLCV